MRSAVLGGLVVLGLVAVLAAGSTDWGRAFGQSPMPRPPASSAGEIIALSFDEPSSERQVVVVDAKSRILSVYHVDRKTGELTLKSVRNVTWDLQMEEYNGNSPTPQEIRRLLERR